MKKYALVMLIFLVLSLLPACGQKALTTETTT